MENVSLNKTAYKLRVRTLEAQTSNVDFIESRLNDHTDVIVVWYPATSTSEFRFHGNVMKAIHIWQNIYNVFTLISYYVDCSLMKIELDCAVVVA